MDVSMQADESADRKTKHYEKRRKNDRSRRWNTGWAIGSRCEAAPYVNFHLGRPG